MRFERTCLESIGYCLPQEIVTSEQLERQLAPLYERLRLPEGRLELMTGIRERRVWPVGMLPGDKSIESGELAIQAAGIDRSLIGALVHGSVCRDHLEPATACRVHHGLGLPADCAIFDVSNACLGLLTGAMQIANMIELGQIRAGLVVGSEDSRHLMEATVEMLNRDDTLSRSSIKMVIASLTIGSGSCAWVLTDTDLSRTGNRLLTATVRANTQYHHLCQSGRDEAAAGGMRPLMNTDSEALMREGIATGQATFDKFLAESGWDRADINRVFCHQVGATHRKLMLEALGLSLERDYVTVDRLGNTGSVALPLTMAIGLQAGAAQPGDKLALLGIGSGINCVMMGTQLVGPIPIQSRG
ncbi:MAG: 3-oxoacyl-ACP synthase III [Planctomycetales bacterium]|nr:3-oxoacyl-ACP synthase III [Planctomycetales bacterium]